MLVLGEGAADGLDDITITAAKYSVKITGSKMKISLSLHCNANLFNTSHKFLYANGVKIYIN